MLITLTVTGVSSQNAPIFTANTVKSNGPSIIVPVTVANFTNIGAGTLTLYYDKNIVTATAVNMGSSFPISDLQINITIPGIIIINWFSINGLGQTHPDNSVMFNISFNRIQAGTSYLTWNGSACEWGDGSGSLLNDIPKSTYYINGEILDHLAPITSAPFTYSCPGSMVSIPVTVEDFYSIGSVSLTMNYNSSVLTYVSYSTNPAYVVTINGSNPGTIKVVGTSIAGGTTLPDNTVFFTMNFTYHGGTTGLNWYDEDYESCDYADAQLGQLRDWPQEDFYIDGSVSPAADLTWTGLVDSDWLKTGNWSCGTPISTSRVTIGTTPNNPVIATEVLLNSLTIELGTSVTLTPTAKVDITSTLINNAGEAGLLIQSNATGTGSLINGSSAVSATVERYISGTDNYHYFSMPITSARFIDMFPSPWDPFQVWVREFDEPGNAWVNKYQTDPATVGRGYASYLPASPAPPAPSLAMFKGTLNSGDISYPLSYTASGWNLLGNPYPSAIDWDLITKNTEVDGTVYVWDVSGNYITWNGSIGNLVDGKIPATQGFFAHASAALASVTFTDASRVHSNASFWKSKTTLEELLTIKITNNANIKSDKVFINFNQEATSGFDSQFDAYKLAGDADAPEIFTAGNPILSTNVLNSISETSVIPLGFKAGVEGIYTLTAEGMETFTNGEPILLEDVKTGILTDLRTQPAYYFTSETGTFNERFMLRFAPFVGIQKTENLILHAYANGKTIYVSIPEGYTGTVNVYNVFGQLVANKAQISPGMINIDLNSAPGAYVVQLITPDLTLTRKVITR